MPDEKWGVPRTHGSAGAPSLNRVHLLIGRSFSHNPANQLIGAEPRAEWVLDLPN